MDTKSTGGANGAALHSFCLLSTPWRRGLSWWILLPAHQKHCHPQCCVHAVPPGTLLCHHSQRHRQSQKDQDEMD